MAALGLLLKELAAASLLLGTSFWAGYPKWHGPKWHRQAVAGGPSCSQAGV